MIFEVPENCGLCLSKKQFGDYYICSMPAVKEKEILDASAFKVPLDCRPDWCPKKSLVDNISSLSEENRALFDKMCEGISAMLELINNTR